MCTIVDYSAHGTDSGLLYVCVEYTHINSMNTLEYELGQGIGLGFFVCVIVHLAGSISGDQSLYYNLMAIFWLFMGIVASLNISNRVAIKKENNE